ncbi:MAG: glycosyltransferase family 4 protein [Phycisphaerae bacterium]|jgi:glycosyltransferase involved in cell wall biosynthesis|nr:glycosyltransferase family 4 protein [Phycisphaerae bacterium]
MTDRASSHSPHVAAVVINSVAHDARVLKEADGLAAAGYRVTIYGIQDSRCNEPVTIRPSGVVIRRAEWRSQAFRMKARMIVAGTGAAVIAGCVVLWAILAGHGDHPVVASVTALLVLVVLGAGMRHARRAMAAAHNTARNLSAASRRVAANGSVVEVKPGPTTSAPVSREVKRPQPQGPRNRIARWRSNLKTWYANQLRVISLVDLIMADRPDAVHAHDLQAMPVGWRVKRRLGCPLIFDSHELHDDLSQISGWGRRRSRRQQAYYSGRVDGFVTVNESIAETMRQRYPRLPEAVIVRNATRFDGEVVADDGRLHRAAHLDPSTRILLYQGGFARHRGLDSLVRSATLLPEGWVLVMMGWGTFEPTLRGIAQAVDPDEKRVRFLPGAPQAELAQWTAGASLGVIPYENVCLNHWFCTPNKIWEYPVAGVPILASPFPELRKAIEGNGTGVLLDDPVTPENIARTVASVTPERLEAMRTNCQRFLERDNWSMYERRLIELYRRLLGSRSVAPQPAAETVHQGGHQAGATVAFSATAHRSSAGPA